MRRNANHGQRSNARTRASYPTLAVRSTSSASFNDPSSSSCSCFCITKRAASANASAAESTTRDVDVDVDVERGARERAETSDGGLARASTSPLAPTGRARGKVSRALASVGDYFTERANRRFKLALAIASVLALVVLIGMPLSAWAGG